jgi:hypothetical protein
MLTTYKKLEKIVAPVLRAYKTDLTTHDYNILKEYDGPFIYGFRETGTDLLRMLPLKEIAWKNPATTTEQAREILLAELIWINYQSRNNWFLFCFS